MFNKILIANRGEIAVRIIRACRDLGITSVAVYSDADRGAPHVRHADEAYRIGPPSAQESYLCSDRLIEVATRVDADAVHPGYGFLSENADFAEACAAAGLVFIGPSPAAMRIMGNKTTSRAAVAAMDVPLVPGMLENILDEDHCRHWADRIGYPLMLKAAAGGGGKGMRKVENPEELLLAFRAAKSEAGKSFSDDAVYMERFVESPRHIEIQVLGDHHGNLIHLGERECSIQRRHQKVVEEAPSPFVDDKLRQAMGAAAIKAARAVNYNSAGTVEFIVSGNSSEFFFLEMNTRLQVEHPVTEWVTGLDLCQEMIRIAAGEPISVHQDDIRISGHAIECRICAEDPANNFFPAPGVLNRVQMPAGPGIRVDSGIDQGYRVPVEYDPLLAKLIVFGRTRSEALARCQRALHETVISGIATTLPFHKQLLQHPEFIRGEFDTGFLNNRFEFKPPADAVQLERLAVLAAVLHAHRQPVNDDPILLGNTRRPSPWRLAGQLQAVTHR
ncbi:MAG: acetyl-CoA carboxylase biotin carboxylase subunit [Desulfuromonadales bacterium]|nr:acetyl-CoA carboxylase biotin carboxylase subunit [Desulfuromonadales bacterium]